VEDEEKAKRFLRSPSVGNELEVVSYYDAGLMEEDEPEIFLMRLEGVLAGFSAKIYRRSRRNNSKLIRKSAELIFLRLSDVKTSYL
jgi:hypothetical protein